MTITHDDYPMFVPQSQENDVDVMFTTIDKRLIRPVFEYAKILLSYKNFYLFFSFYLGIQLSYSL